MSALRNFVIKIAKLSEATSEEDLQSLRGHGFSDEQILEVIHVVGFFCHINRIAEATGVDLEPWMKPHEP